MDNIDQTTNDKEIKTEKWKARGKKVKLFFKNLLCYFFLPLVVLAGIYLISTNGCIIVRNTVIGYAGFSEHVRIPDKIFFRIPVESIANKAFMGNKRIKSVILPRFLETIGDLAFAECENIEKVKFRSGYVSLGDHAFAGCTNLKEINLPRDMRSIGSGIFWGCENLETVEISKILLNYIPTGTFVNCKRLKSITLGDNIKYMGNVVFANCESLEYITISPKTMLADRTFTNIGDKVKEINYINSTVSEDFYVVNGSIVKYRGNGEKVIIPEVINGIKITDIATSAFKRCDNLKELTIPGSIKAIHNTAVWECRNLTTITCLDGVERISLYAFDFHKGFEKMILPKNAVIYDHKDKPIDLTELYYGLEVIRR